MKFEGALVVRLQSSSVPGFFSSWQFHQSLQPLARQHHMVGQLWWLTFGLSFACCAIPGECLTAGPGFFSSWQFHQSLQPLARQHHMVGQLWWLTFGLSFACCAIPGECLTAGCALPWVHATASHDIACKTKCELTAD